MPSTSSSAELRGCDQDFGGIPIVLFCGDFHQFRPVQERSILLPSAVTSWDLERSFGVEQRHQHDRAHALWRKFATVVILDEQVRAAKDPLLQSLLTRIRRARAGSCRRRPPQTPEATAAGAGSRGIRDHGGDAAEPQPLEPEHRGLSFVPKAAASGRCGSLSLSISG